MGLLLGCIVVSRIRFGSTWVRISKSGVGKSSIYDSDISHLQRHVKR